MPMLKGIGLIECIIQAFVTDRVVESYTTFGSSRYTGRRVVSQSLTPSSISGLPIFCPFPFSFLLLSFFVIFNCQIHPIDSQTCGSVPSLAILKKPVWRNGSASPSYWQAKAAGSTPVMGASFYFFLLGYISFLRANQTTFVHSCIMLELCFHPFHLFLLIFYQGFQCFSAKEITGTPSDKPLLHISIFTLTACTVRLSPITTSK